MRASSKEPLGRPQPQRDGTPHRPQQIETYFPSPTQTTKRARDFLRARSVDDTALLDSKQLLEVYRYLFETRRLEEHLVDAPIRRATAPDTLCQALYRVTLTTALDQPRPHPILSVGFFRCYWTTLMDLGGRDNRNTRRRSKTAAKTSPSPATRVWVARHASLTRECRYHR